MLREALLGAAAGAAGTTALNVSTYADMVIRGRPESQVPAEVAGELASRVGVPLANGATDGAAQKAQHRKSALGSLMGYGIGLGLGVAYGLLRPPRSWPWRVLGGMGLGLAAMAASDAPATALKKTNPATWGAAGWIADLVPHLAYGLVTSIAYDALADQARR